MPRLTLFFKGTPLPEFPIGIAVIAVTIYLYDTVAKLKSEPKESFP